MTDDRGTGSAFATLLARFEAELVAIDAPIVSVLAPGIPADEVREQLAEHGMEPAEELVDWFGWHNGFTRPPVNGAEGRVLVWTPLSLAEAILWWHREDKGSEVWQWRPTWLPFALSGGLHRLAVDCTPPQAVAASVRGVRDDMLLFAEEERLPRQTMASAVAVWLRALQEGWFSIDREGGGWQSDDAAVPREVWMTSLL